MVFTKIARGCVSVGTINVGYAVAAKQSLSGQY